MASTLFSSGSLVLLSRVMGMGMRGMVEALGKAARLSLIPCLDWEGGGRGMHGMRTRLAFWMGFLSALVDSTWMIDEKGHAMWAVGTSARE